MADEKKRCAGQVWHGGWRGHACRLPAKHFENGKWYCGTHAPSKKLAREEKKEAQRMREQEYRIRRKEKRNAEYMIKEEIVETVEQMANDVLCAEEIKGFVIKLMELADKLSEVRKR